MAEDKQYNGFKLGIDEISILTFNCRTNIFSSAVIKDFIRAISNLPKGVKVLVITGEGATFMAGADIKEMSLFGPSQATAFAKLFQRAMDAVEGFTRPVVAGVNGFALGGGCELVLACDLAIASEAAVFATPEINLGIIPGGGGTQRLKERVGKLMATELILTGKKIGAAEALQIGLVNRVAAKDKLMDEVISVARTIASKPVQCIEAAKRLINSGSLTDEIEAFGILFSYEDQKRLMKDFLKKK